MPIDLLIVLLFMIYSITAGLRARKKASVNLEEYFLAGRTLKGWQAGFSMAATQYAADTPLLVTGLVATAGVFSLWRLWVYAIAFFMLAFFFSGCWRRSQILTDAELTELRYGGRGAACLRALKAIHLGTLFNCSVLAMVLIAAMRISELFLLWHEWLPSTLFDPLVNFLEISKINLTSLAENHPEVGRVSASNLISILLIVLFTTFYSTTGGLRGVVSTDIVQFSITMIATLIYAWIVLDQVGGFSGLYEKLGSLYSEPVRDERLAFFPKTFNSEIGLILGVLFVQWFAQVNSDGTGYLAQRTMACESDRDARRAAIIFTWLQVVLRSLLWLPIALGLLILYPVTSLPALGEASEMFRTSRETTFAMGIKDFMPVGVRGLMLTGLLAALASTIDTHLNWGASYWSNDLYKRFIAKHWLKKSPSNRELVWVARFSNVGLLVIAMGILMRLSSIQSAWHLSLLFGSGLGVVLILRWWWWRINIYSEYSAAISSMVIAPILLLGFPEMEEGARLLWMLSGTTLTLVLATLLTPPEAEEKLIVFYKRVRPPGLWGPIALKVDGDLKTSQNLFNKALLETMIWSLCVFGVLVLLGQWMLHP